MDMKSMQYYVERQIFINPPALFALVGRLQTGITPGLKLIWSFTSNTQFQWLWQSDMPKWRDLLTDMSQKIDFYIYEVDEKHSS